MGLRQSPGPPRPSPPAPGLRAGAGERTCGTRGQEGKAPQSGARGAGALQAAVQAPLLGQQGEDTEAGGDHLPPPFLSVLRHPPLTEVPRPPRAPTRPAGRSGLRPSVARYRGGGVLPVRWLGEKMGCPRPGGRPRDGGVTSETRARGPRGRSLSPPRLLLALAHPGAESGAGGCARTRPPPARRARSREGRAGPGVTALRPTSLGPPAADERWENEAGAAEGGPRPGLPGCWFGDVGSSEELRQEGLFAELLRQGRMLHPPRTSPLPQAAFPPGPSYCSLGFHLELCVDCVWGPKFSYVDQRQGRS